MGDTAGLSQWAADQEYGTAKCIESPAFVLFFGQHELFRFKHGLGSINIALKLNPVLFLVQLIQYPQQ